MILSSSFEEKKLFKGKKFILQKLIGGANAGEPIVAIVPIVVRLKDAIILDE